MILDFTSREAFSQKGNRTTTPHVSYGTLTYVVWKTLRIPLWQLIPITEEEYINTVNRHKYVNMIVNKVLTVISESPNPSSVEIYGTNANLEVAFRNGIDMHHRSDIKDLSPANATQRSYKKMKKELTEGDCVAIHKGDHRLITMYDNDLLNEEDVEDWIIEHSQKESRKRKRESRKRKRDDSSSDESDED